MFVNEKCMARNMGAVAALRYAATHMGVVSALRYAATHSSLVLECENKAKLQSNKKFDGLPTEVLSGR